MMKFKQHKVESATTEQVDGRRRFLRKSLTLGAAVPALTSAFMCSKAAAGDFDFELSPRVQASFTSPRPGALASLPEMATRRLHLVNSHTGDDVDLVYFTHGMYIQENLAAFNHLMRDRRANIATNMDTTLYDQLFLLQSSLETEGPVHVLSGYRTAETNAKLRRRSSGVAKYSLHMEGRAADIYVPGYSAGRVQKAALSLKAGGVGIYSRSGFVHMDTGRVRQWGS